LRFKENGPGIPDELLVARDEGQVLFFCGAGVSTATANLPGFLELARRVLSELRALPDSTAQRLIEIAKELQKKPIQGVGSILAADRIFGLLERDFELRDIDRAVGCALKPEDGASLEAHRILFDLSKGPNGRSKIITTNFDLLFEQADRSLAVITPSQLPDLRRNPEFEGIVHLHGVLDSNYQRAVGGRLVLSSSEFGRAYLAEGWATDFIRTAIGRYRLVFVGYTADDPPVQYLLEALNRGEMTGGQGLYAFQSGLASDATALWRQKGVTAIPYSRANNHADLWDTLAAWAERARDPNRWRNRLLKQARRGPATMSSHQRGQVVHLAATSDGARAIAEAKQPIPAEWICVFDPNVRYGTPGKANIYDYAGPDVNPFTRYGIDSDPIPPEEQDGRSYKRRETPKRALDVLVPLLLDGDTAYISGLRQDSTSEFSPIPSRLVSLAVWFMRICGEPAAMWWAAAQWGLHPVMLRNIQFALDDAKSGLTPVARTVWRYLFDAWRSPSADTAINGFVLNQRLLKEGWTSATRRAFGNHFAPALKARRPSGAVPPQGKRKLRQRDVLQLSVGYPEDQIRIEIPESQIELVLPFLRKNIEHAASLERELYPYPSYDLHIPPIEPDPNLPGQSSDRGLGLDSQIQQFVDLFRALLDKDRVAALREFEAWPRNDDPVFARLLIWAAGLSNFLDPDTSGRVLVGASDRVFWGQVHQRDLLLALARRWSAIPQTARAILERRLRKGPPNKRSYSKADFAKFRAYSVADRLSWLKAEGCQFDFDADFVIAKQRSAIPNGDKADGSHAADSMEGRGGGIHTDNSYAEFVDTPIGTLIAKALAAQDRRHGFLEERDPYAGLVRDRPLRVLGALRLLKDASPLAQRAWAIFLQSGARPNDKLRLTALIARRLVATHPNLLEKIVSAASYWFEHSAKRLFELDRDAAEMLFDRLRPIISGASQQTAPGAAPNADRDWFEEGLNSPVGRLVAVLFGDPKLASSSSKSGLPVSWTKRADSLLQIPGDQSNLVLARFARDLGWLFARDPNWAEQSIIAPIDREGDARDAMLAGFFTNANINGELFLRLKPALFALAVSEAPIRKRREAVVASLFISGWQAKSETGVRYVTDDELRAVIVHGTEAMRTRMLWQVGHWQIDEKLTLLGTVWPLQLAARSSTVSGRLLALVFDDEVNFAALADATLPLLSQITHRDILLGIRYRERTAIIDRFPRTVLDLLSRVVPEPPQELPYDTGDLLTKLLRAEPRLAKDQKFAGLRRRQAASR
jgi:SIR2-like domain